MQSVYTESMLKPMKKVELYEILLALEVEVDKAAEKDAMIAMILAKNPPADDGDNTPDLLTETPPNEPKADDGTNNLPDEGNATKGQHDAYESYKNPPTDDDLPKFTPEQLLKSLTYSHRRDVLRTLLNDDETYSHADIARILKEFYETEVK